MTPFKLEVPLTFIPEVALMTLVKVLLPLNIFVPEDWMSLEVSNITVYLKVFLFVKTFCPVEYIGPLKVDWPATLIEPLSTISVKQSSVISAALAVEEILTG